MARKPKLDGLALRLSGTILLVLAAFVGRHLFAVADPQATFRAVNYLLALIGIGSACGGAALTILGPHLFDQVKVSPRWTIHDTTCVKGDNLASLNHRLNGRQLLGPLSMGRE